MYDQSRRIHINHFDLTRLKLLLKSQGDLRKPEKKPLRELADALQNAVTISPEIGGANTVMMNSHVRLRNVRTGEMTESKLVFPGKSNKGLGKLSVLTPLGASLLGRQTLDTLSVALPEGVEEFRVEEVVDQHEAEAVLA